jgi:hypothetical protein
MDLVVELAILSLRIGKFRKKRRQFPLTVLKFTNIACDRVASSAELHSATRSVLPVLFTF